MKRGFIFALLLLPTFTFARKEKVSETVTAYKDGETKEITWLVEGSTRSRTVVTNYIVRKGEHGRRVLLTVKCDERFRWNYCFPLAEGQSYSAVFENGHGKAADIVSITGQPEGNLTKPIAMTPSSIVNMDVLPSEEEPAK